jgi:acyl-CoA thioester hydrolase
MSNDASRVNEARGCFRYFLAIPTRWKDNDIYGHVNNVVYYSYFDTAITHYLMVEAQIDILRGAVLPFTVESKCRYYHSLSFPDVVDTGLRVARLGNSSVRYEIGLFRQHQDQPAAAGYFVDVFVDRQTQKSVSMPQHVRSALEKLVPQDDEAVP